MGVGTAVLTHAQATQRLAKLPLAAALLTWWLLQF
jgi:hypothetical protein